jgi:uncharacterized membrane protein
MYQKIMNYLTNYQDKVLHFSAGMIICLIASIFLPLWMSFVLVLAAGIGKETRDQIVYRGWDWLDLLATISGGTFVLLCLIFNK